MRAAPGHRCIALFSAPSVNATCSAARPPGPDRACDEHESVDKLLLMNVRRAPGPNFRGKFGSKHHVWDALHVLAHLLLWLAEASAVKRRLPRCLFSEGHSDSSLSTPRRSCHQVDLDGPLFSSAIPWLLRAASEN